MAKSNTFSGLLQCILVAMNLGKNGTELHLETSYYHQLSHPIADALLIQINLVYWQLFKGLINAGSTLLKHLHLLVTQRHIMEHYEKMVFISSTRFEINHVHYTIGFLQKIECPFELFSLDESIRAIIKLCHDNWDFIF